MRRSTEAAHLAIHSLLQQTLPTWELVLVGAGVERVIEAFGGADSRLRHPAVNVGPLNWATSLNQAVASTESPFLAFIDGDDVAVAERLEMQSEFLSRQLDYGFVAAWSASLALRGSWIRHTFPNARPERLLAFLLHENIIRFGTVMIRRACFDQLGGFDEHVPSGADHDLWLRIGLRSRLAALPRVLCWHLPRDRRALQGPPTADWTLPDAHRQRDVERLLEVHPYGRQILEEALSRYPEDPVLWACHSRLRGIPRPADGRPAGELDSTAASDVSLLHLRCLRYRREGAAPFNDLAQEYLRRGNRLLAHLCDLRSLAVDPHQRSVFDQAYRARMQGITQPSGFSRAGAEHVGGACTVSVLMPTYNRADVIRESIQSVLDQTFRDLELVIVDDGSTDETKETVRALSDPRIRYIRTPHRGLAAALNSGAGAARGRYLAYLDDDDVYYPDHLARLVHVLETSGASLVYAKGRMVCGHYEDGRFRPELEFGTSSAPYDEDRLHRHCIMGTLNVLHRRECLTEAGGFDERLPRCMDWDLWVRLSERYPIVHVDALTGENRYHRGNMTAGSFFEGRVLTYLLEDYFGTCRGLAILLRAAHLQGRVDAREQVRNALEACRLALGEQTFVDLLSLLPSISRGSGLIRRLFAFRPHWYLNFLASRLRTRHWSVLADIPVTLYPRLVSSTVDQWVTFWAWGKARLFVVSPFFWHRCRILIGRLVQRGRVEHGPVEAGGRSLHTV